MQQTSDLYKELLAAYQSGQSDVKLETRLSIGEAGVLITKQGDSITFGSKEYTKTASGSTIVLTETEDRPMKGLRVFGKTTQDGTPTPDAPVPLESVGESVNVTVCGKNLFDYRMLPAGTQNGITVTNNGDGSFTNPQNAAGAYNHSKTYSNEDSKRMFRPGKYTFSLGLEYGTKHYPYVYVNFRNNAGSLYEFSYEGSTFTLTKDMIESDGFNVRVGFYMSASSTPTAGTVYPMLRMSGDDTFEPYKDGGSVTVSTPNGLPGIPVTSGGNYTDENGQQWVCDEVDFGRGVYVQRVYSQRIVKASGLDTNNAGIKRFYATLDQNVTTVATNDTKGNLLCNHLPVLTPNEQYVSNQSSIVIGKQYIMLAIVGVTDMNSYLASNDVRVVYQMATPLETTLSAEELAAYAALHTNYPNTTVFNDEGAYMEIEYTMNGDGPARILTGATGADSGYDESLLESMGADFQIFSDESPTVGNCVSAEIDVVMVKPFGELPRQARLAPYVRLTDGSRYSEWIQKGVFYIDTRTKKEDGSSIEKIQIHGYDDMLKAEQDYPSSTLSWPAADIDVVREIAAFIGVSIDPRTIPIINRGYPIQYPAGYSCRDVLGYIAASYAGCFVMSDIGELRLITIHGIPKETRYLIDTSGSAITFGGVRILV